MTTVVYRSGVMASDSRFSGCYASVGQKLFKRGTTLVGICGDVPQALKFVDWYFNRTKPVPVQGDDESQWEALVATPKVLEVWDHVLRPVPIPELYAAIGSGAPYAMGAMDHGAKAAEAVRIAIKRDINSGGTIKTIRFTKEPT